MPFLKGDPPKHQKTQSDVGLNQKNSTSGEIPAYRMVEIATSGNGTSLETELHEREDMVEHWRQRCEGGRYGRKSYKK